MQEAYKDRSLTPEQRADDLVGRMTLDEKIRQMTQADSASLEPSDIDHLFLGSVLSGGDSAPPDPSARGWAAMVEATPIKLSYVVYPGETFFDGQLVAIEENRLVFRREVVWADGRREKTVEIKPLRKPSPVEDMAARAPANPAAPEAVKPSTPEKQ